LRKNSLQHFFIIKAQYFASMTQSINDESTGSGWQQRPCLLCDEGPFGITLAPNVGATLAPRFDIGLLLQHRGLHVVVLDRADPAGCSSASDATPVKQAKKLANGSENKLPPKHFSDKGPIRLRHHPWVHEVAL